MSNVEVKEAAKMELMSIKQAIEFVECFKKICPNDYKDINLRTGGKFLMYLKDLETLLEQYKGKKDIEYMALTVKGYIILNRYEWLDVKEINLHSPIEILSV